MPADPTAPRPLSRRDLLGTGVAAAILAAADAVAAESPAPARLTLQPFDKVPPQKYPWGWIRWVINAEVDPDAEMTLGIVHIEPNQSNPLHIHPNSAEYLHVLSGLCEHRVGDRWVTLKTGDTLRVPKGVVHMARTKGEPCRVMVIYDTGKRQMVPVAEEKKQ